MPEPTFIPDTPTVKTLLDAGRAMSPPVVTHGGVPFVVLPDKYKVESLAPLLPKDWLLPGWVAQRVQLQEAPSFCAYVNLFKTWRSRIFAEVTDGGARLECVLDYHEGKVASEGKARIEAATPERGAHRAILEMAHTKEWKVWMEDDREKMTQGEFALFLEENERVFRTPGGADLREMVLSLEGHSNARFNSAIRLQDGRLKMAYEEDVELRGSHGEATGHIELPGEFVCGIAPFEGVAPYEVRARLRYRIAERRITFWYETITPHLIVRDAAAQVLALVEEQTGIAVLKGKLL